MRSFLFICLIATFSIVNAQIPSGYYNQAEGLSGTALQQTLHNIIDNHNALSHGGLWSAYEDTDKKSNGKVWDMYSDVPGGNPPYQFTFFTDQCGNYGGEGDCYNREHSFPRSWFGGTVAPMNTDLFQVYPTDGYVNGKRSNLPYGEVGSASWTSQNGCKVGSSVTPGYSGTVFEPIDEYKGDFARTYFYMATRYYGEDNSWPGSPMVNGSQPKEWALDMLFQWHQEDPVSQKEIDRNNAVYDYQNNRNPFIDHPEYTNLIWFNTTLSQKLAIDAHDFNMYPNPVSDRIHIELSADASRKDLDFAIVDQTGRVVFTKDSDGTSQQQFDVSILARGMYFFIIHDSESNLKVSKKIVK